MLHKKYFATSFPFTCRILIEEMKKSITDTRLLIKKIQGGDKKAFQSLIEEYQQLVSHIVFRMVYNKADREDLCQEIFIKVYQNLRGFRFESKISTWIAKIAYNSCINYLQKKKIPLFADRVGGDKTIEDFSGNYILPDSLTEEKDIASRLQTEIAKMDPPSRTILTLYHLEEMSYIEISQIMGIPQGTVKSYLFRARKKLREKLMSKYQKEEIWHTDI